MGLFRKEAVQQQQQRLTGSVSLAQPVSIAVITVVILTITTVIISFLFLAQYTRKESVQGFLISDKGLIRGFSGQAGVIELLYVAEGDMVVKGQKLANINVPKASYTSQRGTTHLSEQLVFQYQQQLALIDSEIQQQKQLLEQELVTLKASQEGLYSERQSLLTQTKLATAKLQLIEQQQQSLQALYGKNHLTLSEYQSHRQIAIDAEQELHSYQRLLFTNHVRMEELAYKIDILPNQLHVKLSSLQRQKSEIQNQLLHTQANATYTVLAPHSGVVTAVLFSQGETVANNTAILTILPENSNLVAELLVPSRSIGFVKLGQTAKLRFDAFPYQRFGFINSEVISIEQTLVTPSEIKLPINIREPVYRLRAKLPHQYIQAYGKDFPLKTGMQLEADISLDKRSLLDWLFEPIYSLKGKLN
ncbi:HlyD family secretion protein [Paraferrimonas sp. SM1919]|uniref:HlyD family secretion protein n=1 Tax=Paraferrimonas sp. SM1919 TaxID=2662263 RepID=UPI0013D4311B|nr:efflux RND transporter periplasmic adaptor subunit [Paraferrimonas sp. SM1919]